MIFGDGSNHKSTKPHSPLFILHSKRDLAGWQCLHNDRHSVVCAANNRKRHSNRRNWLLYHVLAGFFGGTLIDRLGFKRTSIISDLASGVTTALIPLLYLTMGLEFWLLMIGLATAQFITTLSMAFIPL